MTAAELNKLDTPATNWTPIQQALWYDLKGDWAKAHDLIDHLQNTHAAHVHAYLHRKEGDSWNAQYWYSRAQQQMSDVSLEEEWQQLFDLYF